MLSHKVPSAKPFVADQRNDRDVRSGPRREIGESWHRTMLSGLTPEDHVRLEFGPCDPTSRLMAASTPVLEDLESQLEGLQIGCLLADKKGVIVGRYFGDPRLADVSDTVGAQVGAVFDEAHAGTNALSTALETRAPILVNEEDHYLASMKQFVCYGAPIMSPLTRRSEGVVDLMAPAGTDPSLMKAVVTRAVRDIENRLLSDYDDDVAAAVALFHSIRRTSPHALLFLGQDLLIQNARCSELLDPEDIPALRDWLGAGEARRPALRLARGDSIRVSVRQTGRSALLELRTAEAASAGIPRGPNAKQTASSALTATLDKVVTGPGHVYVCGERGSGRTATALRIAGPDSFVVHLDEHQRFEEVMAAAASTDNIVLDGLDLVSSDTLLQRLGHLIDDRAHGRIIVVGGPTDTLGMAANGIASRCTQHVQLAPLRDRANELPAICSRLLADLGADRSVRLTLAAVEVLGKHAWPGNLGELRMVLRDALANRSTGDIGVRDLPQRYQVPPTQRNLTLLERAERETIVRVLEFNQGNKARAAHQLGLSRSTLYSRLRYFEIGRQRIG